MFKQFLTWFQMFFIINFRLIYYEFLSFSSNTKHDLQHKL